MCSRATDLAADPHPVVPRVPEAVDVDLRHGRPLGVHEHEAVPFGDARDLLTVQHECHRNGEARPVHELPTVADASTLLGADEPVER